MQHPPWTFELTLGQTIFLSFYLVKNTGKGRRMRAGSENRKYLAGECVFEDFMWWVRVTIKQLLYLGFVDFRNGQLV